MGQAEEILLIEGQAHLEIEEFINLTTGIVLKKLMTLSIKQTDSEAQVFLMKAIANLSSKQAAAQVNKQTLEMVLKGISSHDSRS